MPNWVSLFFSENVYHLQLQKNQAPLKGRGLKKYGIYQWILWCYFI